jgi:hypothetical protein
VSNFRLNLPVDIPWKLIDCSADMIDTTFCNAQFPSPFRSSLAIYAYEPKAEELPPELCGDRITYLKVSCTIAGYQPSEDDKDHIVRLLEGTEIDYAVLQQVVDEYFGCYGVLLNVAVHPYDDALQEDLDKYPRIIDFEPKLRDFHQVASETGEVLTTSNGKLATTKSFGSTETTQNSWNAEAGASIPAEGMAALTGVPVGVNTRGSTGHVRTESDQQNWSNVTDASRERKERQATTTELNQMYNLLTGYHTGSNRAAFLMLPRPHILQPTDRRTFVQGLRIIEGVQDFFLVVVRPAGQDKLKVDAHLQTGHFPDNVTLTTPTENETYDTIDQTFPINDTFTNEDSATIFGDGFVRKRMTKTLDVVDETNGWEADPTKGDPGHGGVRQILPAATATITRFDFETGRVMESFEVTVPAEQGIIEDVEYGVTNGLLVVSATLKLRRRNGFEVFFGPHLIAEFNRYYQVFLRRPKVNAPVPTAEMTELLITQRSLCVQIGFGDCIHKIKTRNPFDGIRIVHERPFDIHDLYSIPSVDAGRVKGVHPKGPRLDFAFKKGLLRKLGQAMVSSGSSPFRYSQGSVSYTQTRFFQRRLLAALPAEVLDRPLKEIGFVNNELKGRVNSSLREFLTASDAQVARQLNVPLREARALKGRLLVRGEAGE